MSLLDVGKNLVSSATGNVCKGALLINNINEYTEIEGASNGLAKYQAATSLFDPSGSAFGSLMGGAASLMGDLGLSMGMLSPDMVKASAKAYGYHYLEFQYNPEVISLHSQAGKFQSRQGAAETGINQITNTTIPGQTSVAFSLRFYQINNQEAFAQDKLLFNNPNAIINKIQLFTATESLMTTVDGLVSLLMQKATRQVIFVFSDMIFRGELEHLDVRYTMFSPTGHPIAAEVNVSIRQTSKTQGNDEKAIISDTMYWEGAFDKLFGKPGVNVDVDARSVAGKVGSLVNLNM